MVFIGGKATSLDSKNAAKRFGVFQHMHSHEVLDGTDVGTTNFQRIIRQDGGQAWVESAVI